MHDDKERTTDPEASPHPHEQDVAICASTPQGRVLVSIANRLLELHANVKSTAKAIEEVSEALGREADRSVKREKLINQVREDFTRHRQAVERRLDSLEARHAANGHGH